MPVTRSEREQKIEFVRRTLRSRKIDALLVTSPENRRYLSGFEATDPQLNESSGALLISQNKLILVTDSRYELDAGEQAPDYEIILLREGFTRTLGNLLRRLGIRRVGVESQYLSLFDYNRLLKLSHVEFALTRGLIERLRLKKTSTEISKIQKAVDLCELVMKEIFSLIRPGITEKEVAWKIEEQVRISGAEDVSFQPIVASGPNGAKPHAVPSDRHIGEGEPVILDMGTKLEGYCSDMTRTFFQGEPNGKFKEIYKIVREAQLRAISAIRNGVHSAEIDGIARKFISESGYGKEFGHALGHGVGLAVHEAPRLSPKSKDILQTGMVVTVEPGIYIPSLGGVRLENMVLVQENDCRVLNRGGMFYNF